MGGGGWIGHLMVSGGGVGWRSAGLGMRLTTRNRLCFGSRWGGREGRSFWVDLDHLEMYFEFGICCYLATMAIWSPS